MNNPKYAGKLLLYPCAGQDFADPVNYFGEFIDTFIFVDINYRFNLKHRPNIPGWFYISDSEKIIGKIYSPLTKQENGKNKFRFVEPGWLFLDYKNEKTNRKIQIVLRRGFGQYALRELEDKALTVFMHRGDSIGESGSGVYFLANRKTNHQPLSMLLDAIKQKLKMPGFIVSDGSNSTINELKNHIEKKLIPTFESHGLLWRKSKLFEPLQGFNKTFIWEVEQL